MVILLVIIIALLLFVIFLQFEKINASKNILASVNAMRDILYCCEVTPTLKYKFLSPSVDQHIGKGSYDIHIKNPNEIFELVHPDDLHLLEKKKTGEIDFNQPIIFRIRNMKGEYVWFEDLATSIYENEVFIGVIGVYRRIDSFMKKINEIEYKVSHDKLTGVYNRYYFEEIIEHYNEKQNVPIALAIIDLDNLKQVNDNLGHSTGDTFISRAATILKECTCEKVTVCRIGGDEFAVIFEDATRQMIDLYYEKVLEKLANQDVSEPIIHFSMGHAFDETSIGNMQKLYVQADKMMYEIKRVKQKEADRNAKNAILYETK